ncbi:MAG TPA: RseA family anti-sigma factor [Usitatibacter sp.]|jgi:sigma-E factor negative regulatory protein RseA|nr:RseA family anti-sigma factor [Usitatibacter sp.]
MTQELSSLMDGELGNDEAHRAIGTCCASEEQKHTWLLYHCIGDAMRGQAPRRVEMPDAVFASIKDEPTVLAPRRWTQATVARVAMAAAASVATVGVVGWLGSQGGASAPAAVPVIAKGTSPMQPVANTAPVAATAPVSVTEDVQAYLAAHRQVPSPDLYRNVNNNRATATAR